MSRRALDSILDKKRYSVQLIRTTDDAHSPIYYALLMPRHLVQKNLQMIASGQKKMSDVAIILLHGKGEPPANIKDDLNALLRK